MKLRDLLVSNIEAVELKYKKINDLAFDPVFSSAAAAAFDVRSATLAMQRLYPGDQCVIDTGLCFDIPKDYVLLVFSRSGHGFNYDVSLANCVGVIDEDYTGELKVKLSRKYSPDVAVAVEFGDKIAQCILMPKPKVELTCVESIDKVTARGNNGFGSTGK